LPAMAAVTRHIGGLAAILAGPTLFGACPEPGFGAVRKQASVIAERNPGGFRGVVATR
jgi:hypothetical protein